jgi:hypothetical protein
VILCAQKYVKRTVVVKSNYEFLFLAYFYFTNDFDSATKRVPITGVAQTMYRMQLPYFGCGKR